ncbi:hypothetical protein SDJN03_03269, partial [Cucurbita argyrosperma subsp. sororia]
MMTDQLPARRKLRVASGYSPVLSSQEVNKQFSRVLIYATSRLKVKKLVGREDSVSFHELNTNSLFAEITQT